MDQRGAMHLLLLIGVIGIIAFLGLATVVPFRSNLLSTLFPKQATHAATATEWPQVGKDPQRTNSTSETLGTNWQIKCRYAFQPERVQPIVQPIVYGGNVYIGTEAGKVYAIDAVTCAKKWDFSTGGPIMNSVAADNGTVYVPSMDGAVYGINASTGGQVWRTQLSTNSGFSSAPLLADNKIMLGGRDGKFYALDLSGNKLWEYNAGAPILMTAAFNNGKAYFGSMDMFVHAVNTNNGSPAWKSVKLQGGYFRDFWPVVTQGKVIVRPYAKNPYEAGITLSTPFSWWTPTMTVSGQNIYQWYSANLATIKAGNAASIPEFMNAQNTAMANPNKAKQTVFILDEADGVERTIIPHVDVMSLTGTVPPPCVDKDGFLVMPVYFIRATWGRVNLATQRYVDVLVDGLNWNGTTTSATVTQPRGGGNFDENLSPTCTGNMILSLHNEEGNANYTGYFNLANHNWTQLTPGPQNRQIYHNNQGPTDPASVSNGYVYHMTMHELIVRSTN